LSTDALGCTADRQKAERERQKLNMRLESRNSQRLFPDYTIKRPTPSGGALLNWQARGCGLEVVMTDHPRLPTMLRAADQKIGAIARASPLALVQARQLHASA